MSEIAILGAGMAGFGAAHQLANEGVSAKIYDQKPYHGGHTASFKYEDKYIFDEGPHISFTKIERIQQLFADNVNQDYEVIHAYVNNYWKGHWIKHPAQCNLYGLPPELMVNILRDFIQAQHTEPGPIHNYADWLLASYGETFAKTFPMEYGRKYHTTPAENMSTDWLGPRLYRPDLEEVLKGALSPETPHVHYVSNFRYPTWDGFVAYLNPLAKQYPLQLGHKLTRLDPKARQLTFANGTEMTYDQVISSIPLTELIPLIQGAPPDVVEAAQKLAVTTCVVVNIVLNRPDISKAHWTYFYDDDFFFTRLSFPHMLSPNNVPSGTGSIQAEVYYSKKYRPLDRAPEDCIEPVITDLRRCGLIQDDDQILFSNALLIPYANVIFDLDRAEAVATVHGYLDDIGVAYCGRYGQWGYEWTDESFVSGENAAKKTLEKTAVHR
ncbi:MAG: FAD-dependent oxidoreductase [Cyanobacteria bacterium P01_G01_bin.38]